ncbi:MAG: hypothetical protein WBL25_16770 [Anaerolineales bacterium]
MRSQKKSVLLLVGSISLALVSILFGPLGLTGTAQAAPDMILVTFTDTALIQYKDLSGNLSGEGVHVGELRCVGDNCNQKIEFEPVFPGPTTEPLVYEYKFKSRVAFSPEAETVVVSGTGTISGAGPKIRFSFTGVFQNNGNGTVQVRYEASTPEASFIFPAAPGTFSIISNN